MDITGALRSLLGLGQRADAFLRPIAQSLPKPNPQRNVRLIPTAKSPFSLKDPVARPFGDQLFRQYVVPGGNTQDDLTNLQGYLKSRQWLPGNYSPSGQYDGPTQNAINKLNTANPVRPRLPWGSA